MSFGLLLAFLQSIEPLLPEEGVSEIMGNPDCLRGGSCERLTHKGQR
jgi:hypothetical protein